MIPELIELKDGLLASSDREIMKARDIELFPDAVRKYFNGMKKVQPGQIEGGTSKVTVRTGTNVAYFNSDLFEYTKGLGRGNNKKSTFSNLVHRDKETEWYISTVPLSTEDKYLFPLLAKYQFGWCIIAPLEV